MQLKIRAEKHSHEEVRTAARFQVTTQHLKFHIPHVSARTANCTLHLQDQGRGALNRKEVF